MLCGTSVAVCTRHPTPYDVQGRLVFETGPAPQALVLLQAQHFFPTAVPQLSLPPVAHFTLVVMAWQPASSSRPHANGEQSQDRLLRTHFSPQPNGYSWSIETGAQSLRYAYHPTTASSAPSPGMAALALSPSHAFLPQSPSLSVLMAEIEAGIAVQNQAAATNIAVPTPQQADAQQPFAPPIPGRHASASRRSKYSSLDWDAHRETIRRLYMDEEKPLKETMEIMAEQHGFHASLVNIRSLSRAGLCIR